MKSGELRNKLQKRTLKPSSNSWELLDQRLTDNEERKKRRIWVFLKYAASILILVSAGFYFLNSEKEAVVDPIIVSPTTNENFKKSPIILEEDHSELVLETVEVTNKTKKPAKNKEQTKINQSDFISEVVVVEPPKIKKIKAELMSMEKEEVIVDLPQKHVPSVDVEVEELLKTSRIKLTINQEISSKRAVSASALLNEVEGDLDKDLKDKLFETIITTLKTPRKVVITDRGN